MNRDRASPATGSRDDVSSPTHSHLLAAIRTELRHRAQPGLLRVLDAGCGNGHLTGYLQAQLGVDWSTEVYGFDVLGPGVQRGEFLSRTIASLQQRSPDIDWSQRIFGVRSSDPWPFNDDSFDCVVSNQVIEHVADHARFFRELSRVLKPEGVALHCFPVRECFWEWHLGLPLVHRIAGHDQRHAWIRILSRLGLGIFAAHNRVSGVSLDEFSERHADFINLYTNYLSARELLGVVKSCGLRGSYAYTGGLYLQKILRSAGRVPRVAYARRSVPIITPMAFWLLKRVSSITLRIEKADAYRPGH